MLDLLRRRRSVRRFKNISIPPEISAALQESVLRSPSSRGLNPWRFLWVENREKIDKLIQASEHGTEFLVSAPLAVVIAADERVSDVWIEDCSIAAILLQLEAARLGLSSCWGQIRGRYHDAGTPSEQYVKGLFDLPDPWRVLTVVGIGYPDEQLDGHPVNSLKFDRIIAVT